MKIAIGCDHGGYSHKEEVKKHLTKVGHEVIDCGAYSLESCDYPLIGKEVAKLVSNKQANKGIVICTSGQGIMIAANKVKGVRCGYGCNDEVSALMRMHNDANMIAFSQKFMAIEDVIRRTNIFIETDFEGGRHERRVNQIEE